MSPRLSDAQRRALLAIRDGKVFWYTPWTVHGQKPRWSVSRAPGLRPVSVQRVVDMGLAKKGEMLNPVDREVFLTDEGRAALGA